VLEVHTRRNRGISPFRSLSDEREPDMVCDPALVAGDGSSRDSGDDLSISIVSNTGLANIEAWKLLGGFLSQIGSLG
jgi:hypothetical protein